MSEYWSPVIRDLAPYVPGEQPRDRRYVKLNTNENPYPPSPRVLEAVRAAAGEGLRLYPDPACRDLHAALAHHHGVGEGNVFAGNGSDEILAMAFMAFFVGRDPVLFPDVTYSFYDVWCNLLGVRFRLVPLGEDFTVRLDDYPPPSGGVVLANPNAPTGRGLPAREMGRLAEMNPGAVVVVDEAYVDFGGETAIPLVGDNPNLLVVRTLSKSRSLAGLRVGYAVGSEDLIQGLLRVKNSFNSYTLDRLALAGAVEALADEAYFRETCAKVVATRERAAGELRGLGFEVLPSQANFLFASHPSVTARRLFERLREEGVLVRFFNRPRISNHLRISVGTDDEMNVFLDRVRVILAEQGNP